MGWFKRRGAASRMPREVEVERRGKEGKATLASCEERPLEEDDEEEEVI
jgi:hypothetical protein